MSRTALDRMQDPFYAALLFQIESLICQTDTDATEAGMPLTDSQVRSSVVRALETILDSMKTRQVDQPGSRAYLDFARKFSAEARARQ